jgi:hypothetical protein
MRGIDPRTSRMLSERSTIWTTSPWCWNYRFVFTYHDRPTATVSQIHRPQPSVSATVYTSVCVLLLQQCKWWQCLHEHDDIKAKPWSGRASYAGTREATELEPTHENERRARDYFNLPAATSIELDNSSRECSVFVPTPERVAGARNEFWNPDNLVAVQTAFLDPCSIYLKLNALQSL